jgi:ribA/ribD-fused uncharacterized protein
MANAKVVRFNEPSEPQVGAFSVLSPHPIVVRHTTYQSVHHYFLCEKYKGTPAEHAIQNAASLWEVDRHVKNAEASGYQREDWDRVKTDIMLLGTYYKFKQHPDAQILLMQTQSKTIVHHTWNDNFWGDGGDGQGKNLLGVILMCVRKRLLTEEKGKKGGSSKR